MVGQLQESFRYKYMHVACWLGLDKHLSAYVAYYTATGWLLTLSWHHTSSYVQDDHLRFVQISG